MITNLENSNRYLNSALSAVNDLTVARFTAPQGRITEFLSSANVEIELARRVMVAVREAAPRTRWAEGFSSDVRDIENALSSLNSEIDTYWRDTVRRADPPSGEEAEADLTKMTEKFEGRINEFKQAISAQGAAIQDILSFVSAVRSALIS